MKKKVGLLIVSIFLASIILAAYLLWINRGVIFSAGKEQMVSRLADQVMAQLPDDYDRTGARPMVKLFLVASIEGRLRGEKAGQAGEMLHAMMMGKKLTTAEADSFMAAIRQSIPEPGAGAADTQPIPEES